MLPTGSRAHNIDMVSEEADPRVDATLTLVNGERRVTRTVRDLVGRAERIEVRDPNHGATKHYLAVPLLPILLEGLGLDREAIGTETLVFEALDGYASPVTGEVAAREGGWLALDDLDTPGWATIGDKRADPAPLYVVWTGDDRDPNVYPWPWALSRVRVANLEQDYGPTEPGDDAPELARRGHSIFMESCVRCHAINRAGGRLGPELNVPRSIVEYRPEAQIRDYIRNPLAFRYGNMPANPQLSDGDLDALIAYFRAMAGRKVDPGQQIR